MTTDYAALIRDDRVHGSLYSDEEVFDDEMDRIFWRGWVFVGHESEVPQPGDWVTRMIGLEPVIMVRGADGIVRVLSNRCAHRGTALCWTESSSDTLCDLPRLGGYCGIRITSPWPATTP